MTLFMAGLIVKRTGANIDAGLRWQDRKTTAGVTQMTGPRGGATMFCIIDSGRINWKDVLTTGKPLTDCDTNL